MEYFSRLVALLLLLTLSPLIIVITLFCIIFQGFPIFFAQKRIGLNYEVFNIYKFRTMVINSGRIITKHQDNRITVFGRILRKLKIDEIPQLINIIKGEMRFIGPRPEVPDYFNESEFNFLMKIKPGLSDYSSILFRDESRILKGIGGENPYSMLLPIKIELAKYYSRNKSFLLDLKLVVVTLISIVFPNLSLRILAKTFIEEDLPKTKNFLNELYF